MNAAPTVLLWTPFKIQADALEAALRTVAGWRVLRATDEAQAIAALPEADAACFAGASGIYTAALAHAVRASPRLRWLQVLSTGIDGIEEQGVPSTLAMSGVGDLAGAVVAEHAMALLLALARQLPAAVLQGQQALWDRRLAARMVSLEGMRLGLVGFGGIGQGVARRAVAFGMDCIAINRSGANPAPDLASAVYPLTRLHEALAPCDALVVSLPLTAGTRDCLGAAAWAACKPGVLVVNVGRGAVIDTASLADALRTGQVGAAGLDVTEPEPLPADHDLWRLPNVLITPHVGGGGSAAVLRRVCEHVADNARRFLRGEPLRHPVSLPGG